MEVSTMANKRQAKKRTTLQQQFQKERKRLQQAVRRANKRGYEFPENIVPELPKRVTKQSLQRIQSTKPADLYKKSTWVDYSTGEILQGETARKLERQAVALRSAETRRQKQNVSRETKQEKPVTPDVSSDNPKSHLPDYRPAPPTKDYNKPQKEIPSFANIVIQNFRAEMARFPEVAYPIFVQWLEMLQHQYELEDIANMLEQAKQNGLFPDYTVAYRKDLVLSAIGDMMEYLPASEGMKQEIADALEYDEDWELPE